MILLQCREWLRHYRNIGSQCNTQENLVTIATNLSSTTSALAVLKMYKTIYNKKHYPYHEIDFALLGIQVVEEMDSEQLAEFHVYLLEDLIKDVS